MHLPSDAMIAFMALLTAGKQLKGNNQHTYLLLFLFDFLFFSHPLFLSHWGRRLSGGPWSHLRFCAVCRHNRGVFIVAVEARLTFWSGSWRSTGMTKKRACFCLHFLTNDHFFCYLNLDQRFSSISFMGTGKHHGNLCALMNMLRRARQHPSS